MADDTKYRTLTVNEELYVRLDKVRQRKAKKLKLANLSWNSYFSIVADILEGDVKEGQKV